MSLQTKKKDHFTQVLESLEKKFGKGIVMQLDGLPLERVATCSTGSLKLNHALGVGGLPRGRIVEIYGPEASGKTTLALHCLVEEQKQGGLTVLIDTEHAFDKHYAEALGINPAKLLVSQPDYGEQALEVAYQLIGSGKVNLLVLDSVAALLPKSEFEGDMDGTNRLGGQARLMSQGLRKLAGMVHKTGATCLFINQLRHKIGLVFGNPETTPGGNALRYYASVRIDVRKGLAIKDPSDQTIVGHHLRLKVTKNKVAPPFKSTEVPLIYGKGFSRMRELVDLAIGQGVINQSGSWFSYQKEKLAQGKQKLEQLLQQQRSLQEEIEEKVHNCLYLSKI